MPRVPISLLPFQQNTDPTGQRSGSVLMYNSYVDEVGNWRRIPGLASYASLGTGKSVQSFWWSERGYAVFTSAGRLFYQVTSGGTVVEVTLGTGVAISETARVAFVGTKHRLFFASGGSVATWKLGESATLCSAGVLPTAVTHLAYLDAYIIANNISSTTDDSYYFATPHLSDAGGEPTWAAGDTAQGLPDGLTALAVEWRDMLLCGKRSIEFWYDAGTPTPASPFARREGAFVQRGVLAPHSLIGADNTWYFLDHERKVSMLQGSTPQVISMPIDKTLQQINNVTDAFSMVIDVHGRNFYVLSMPSAERTFAYEYLLKQWAEWAQWNPATSSWSQWSGNSHSYCEAWNKHLVGSNKNDGLVYEMTDLANKFGSDPIRALVQTAAIDHQTGARKRSDRLWFRIRSGEPDGATQASVRIRYRDDNRPWSEYHIMDLGAIGKTDNVKWFNRLGIYRTRQWEIVFSSNTRLSLANLEEDVEALML